MFCFFNMMKELWKKKYKKLYKRLFQCKYCKKEKMIHRIILCNHCMKPLICDECIYLVKEIKCKHSLNRTKLVK